MAQHATKKAILRVSVLLFAERGYEAVSVKNIAQAVGIQPASIYNHYNSKEEILKDVYLYYQQHIDSERLEEPDYLPILQKGSASDIIGIFNYPLPPQPPDGPNLFDIVRILWARMYIDKNASAVYQRCVLDQSQQYIMQVFAKGVEIGRILSSTASLETLATIISACRIFAASAVVTDPNQGKWRISETQMLASLSQLLLLSPPLA